MAARHLHRRRSSRNFFIPPKRIPCLFAGFFLLAVLLAASEKKHSAKYPDSQNNTGKLTFYSGSSEGLLQKSLTLGTVVRGDEWGQARKAFTSSRAVINALRGMVNVFGSNNILIMVDKKHSCGTLPFFLVNAGCESISHCVNTVYEAPTMDCILGTLLAAAQTDIIGFINGDILIFKSFADSIYTSSLLFDRFVMVGRRHNNVEPPDLHDSVVDWEELERQTELLPIDGGHALDYFVVSKSDATLFKNLPPFIIGTQRWDNVLLSMFYKAEQVTVVDATFAAPIQHQIQTNSRHGERPAAEYNHNLALSFSGNDYLYGSSDNAKVNLTKRATWLPSYFANKLNQSSSDW